VATITKLLCPFPPSPKSAGGAAAPSLQESLLLPQPWTGGTSINPYPVHPCKVHRPLWYLQGPPPPLHAQAHRASRAHTRAEATSPTQALRSNSTQPPTFPRPPFLEQRALGEYSGPCSITATGTATTVTAPIMAPPHTHIRTHRASGAYWHPSAQLPQAQQQHSSAPSPTGPYALKSQSVGRAYSGTCSTITIAAATTTTAHPSKSLRS
jgi:hypothetical protein